VNLWKRGRKKGKRKPSSKKRRNQRTKNLVEGAMRFLRLVKEQGRAENPGEKKKNESFLRT